MKNLTFVFLLTLFLSFSAAAQRRPQGKPVVKGAPVKGIKTKPVGPPQAPQMSLEEAKAQAEAARKTIEDAARTYIGKGGVPRVKVFFDGVNFGDVSRSEYFESGGEARGIDWASFESVEVKTSEGVLWVAFKFANKLTGSDYWVKAGAVTDESKRDSTSFAFGIPPAESGRIKEIEAAAATLARIVKEKGNVVFSPRSDNPLGKPAKNSGGETPSFDDTAKYIDSALDTINGGKELFCNGHYYRYRNARVDVNYDAAYMVSEYQYELNSSLQGRTGPNDMKYKIKLNDVEEIKIVTGGGWEGCRVRGLWFVEKGKGEKPVMHVPLWEMPDEARPNITLKDEKIYKALNHFRRLIGAPEPLDFK